MRIRPRTTALALPESDLHVTAGDERVHAVTRRPRRSLFGGSYRDLLIAASSTAGARSVTSTSGPTTMGGGAEDAKYRFQWNYPIFFSPHDPKTLYAGCNLPRTTNEGQSRQTDQPRPDYQDKKRRRPADRSRRTTPASNTTAPSLPPANPPSRSGVLWTGSDDGLYTSAAMTARTGRM